MTSETTVAESTDGTGEGTRGDERYVVPPVDIFEEAEQLVLMADLPGVEPDGLDIRVNGDTLTIQARARHLFSAEPLYREYELSGFYREFTMPQDFEPQNADASLKNGVLTLKMPRSERSRPRRVEVHS